jgi:HlyD family secretion protein
MSPNSLETIDAPNLVTPLADFHPLNRFSKTKWAFICLLLILCAGGAYFIYRRTSMAQSAKQRPIVVPVERSTLDITISANGTVEPEQVVNVSPKTAGVLSKLAVKEGDEVQQGQIIAYMDDSNLQGQLQQSQAQVSQQETNLQRLLNGNRSEEIAQAQAQLAEATAKLQQLETGNRSEDIAQAQARFKQAQAKLQQSEDDLQRYQKLFAAGAISQQMFNQKQSERDGDQAKLKETQAALDLQNNGVRSEEIAQAKSHVEQRQQALNLLKTGARWEEIEAARAQVAAAQGNLKTVQAQINDTVIRAAFAGTITRKYADPGAFVTPTTAGSSVSSATSSSILALASTNRVVANVSENQIAQIRLGQPVTITADAYPDQTFQGKVSQISSQAIVQQNVTSFEVKVTLEPAAQRQLRSGMNVSVKFNVAQVQNALTVPSIAITRQKNVTGVMVGAPNQPPKFVPITTGTTVNNRTEVKTGLDGTEHILIQGQPPTQPKSGLELPGLSGGTPSGPPGGGPPGGPPPGGGGSKR